MSTRPTDGRPAPSGRRVLVVDEDPQTVILLKMLLGAGGHDVMGAEDAAQALALATRLLPHLLVLDLELPGGVALARQLRSGVESRAIEIVALTARAPEDVMETVRAIGCKGPLAKPVSPERFLAQVQRYL